MGLGYLFARICSVQVGISKIYCAMESKLRLGLHIFCVMGQRH